MLESSFAYMQRDSAVGATPQALLTLPICSEEYHECRDATSRFPTY
jgi:hypothetical protein